MVRRVRLGRREDGRRSAWAGPPRLLLAATVVGLAVAPFVDHDPVVDVAAHPTVVTAPQTLRTVEPRVQHQYRLATSSTAPLQLAPIDVGVASFNLFRQQPVARAAADVRRLTGQPDVDVVGWQEADPFASALSGVPGWSTKTFARGDGISELAVSWRSSEFKLLSAHERKVALALNGSDGRYPFDTRLVVVVRLQHRATGRVLTVINTHLPQKIEDPAHPGHWLPTINASRARAQLQRVADVWQHAAGRWVVGTGDYNFGARADAQEHPDGGPRETLRRVAVSSYQLLGVGVGPTHRPTARNIDYVWVDRSGLRHHRMQALQQEVLTGYTSDHRPMLVRLRLS